MFSNLQHERLQKEQQQSLACLVQDNVSGDLPNSMMALETLISTAIDTHGEHVGYTFIRKLLEATHGIKAEFHQLQSAKKEAEVKLNTTVAVDKTMEYDLAMSRERLREAQDQLLDSREEAERLRAELAAVRLKQTTTTGDKRSLDDRSELEDDDDQKDEDDFEESDTKRRKGENYFGVIDV